jgi:hypothetical protein
MPNPSVGNGGNIFVGNLFLQRTSRRYVPEDRTALGCILFTLHGLPSKSDIRIISTSRTWLTLNIVTIYVCVCVCVSIDGVWIQWIYWPLIHHSELQASRALPLITTAPAKPFPAYSVFSSRFLPTASNNGDTWASRLQVLLSTVHSTIAISLQSLLCTAQPNWQQSIELVAPLLFFMTNLHGPKRKHRLQQ